MTMQSLGRKRMHCTTRKSVVKLWVIVVCGLVIDERRIQIAETG